MLISEYFNEIPSGKGYYGYWVQIRKNGKNYLKDGTTTNPRARFNSKDYKECQSINPLYFVEFDNEYEMMNFEELNKCYLRQQLTEKKIKGMRWIANDRFTYNKRPKQLPIMYKIGKVKFLEIQELHQREQMFARGRRALQRTKALKCKFLYIHCVILLL